MSSGAEYTDRIETDGATIAMQVDVPTHGPGLYGRPYLTLRMGSAKDANFVEMRLTAAQSRALAAMLVTHAERAERNGGARETATTPGVTHEASDMAALKQRVAKLEAALSAYADEDNWSQSANEDWDRWQLGHHGYRTAQAALDGE